MFLGATAEDQFGGNFRAGAQGTDPDMQTAQGKLRAARAAELDAKRRLVEQVYGLSLSSTTTVRDFVTENDEIETQVNALLAVADKSPDIVTVRRCFSRRNNNRKWLLVQWVK